LKIAPILFENGLRLTLPNIYSSGRTWPEAEIIVSKISEEAGCRGAVGRGLGMDERCIAASVAFPLQPSPSRAIAGFKQ
jgi:hypothetical protein